MIEHKGLQDLFEFAGLPVSKNAIEITPIMMAIFKLCGLICLEDSCNACTEINLKDSDGGLIIERDLLFGGGVLYVIEGIHLRECLAWINDHFLPDLFHEYSRTGVIKLDNEARHITISEPSRRTSRWEVNITVTNHDLTNVLNFQDNPNGHLAGMMLNNGSEFDELRQKIQRWLSLGRAPGEIFKEIIYRAPSHYCNRGNTIEISPQIGLEYFDKWQKFLVEVVEMCLRDANASQIEESLCASLERKFKLATKAIIVIGGSEVEEAITRVKDGHYGEYVRLSDPQHRPVVPEELSQYYSDRTEEIRANWWL